MFYIGLNYYWQIVLKHYVYIILMNTNILITNAYKLIYQRVINLNENIVINN